MPDSIEDYRNLIEQPWGKMFYDMIFRQLNLPKDKKLNILDYGAGFCVTASYYAENHNVTAYEPNPEMLKKELTVIINLLQLKTIWINLKKTVLMWLFVIMYVLYENRFYDIIRYR